MMRPQRFAAYALSALLLLVGLAPAAGAAPLRSLEGDEVSASAPVGRGLLKGRAGVPGAGVGERTLLVLRVYYDGEGWPAVDAPEMQQYSVEQVQSRLTGAAGSAAAMFAAQSGGAVTFRGRVGAPADVSPWLTFSGPLPRSASSGQCDAGTVASQAVTSARALSLDPDGYDHVMIVFPFVQPSSDCPWAGLGQIAGRITWMNGFFQDDALVDGAVAAHELGHNLGVKHASTLACTSPSPTDPSTAVLTSTSCTLPDSTTAPSGTTSPQSEYGDPFEMMGTFLYGFPWRGTELLSTWRRAQLLQLPEASQTVVTAPSTVELAAAGSGSGTRLIRVARGTGSSAMRELALEYRPAGGLFDRWDIGPIGTAPAGGVLVRLVPPLATSDRSFLLDATPETGQTSAGRPDDPTFRTAFRTAWRDAALPVGRTLLDAPSGISVTVRSATSSSAIVELSGGPLGAVPTPTPTPTTTPAPTGVTAPTPTPTPAPTQATGPSGSGGNPASGPTVVSPQAVGAGELLWPAPRRGVTRLTASRRIVVRFAGAVQVRASIGTRWAQTAAGPRASFTLPRSAARSAIVRLRATGADGAAPRTVTLRVRRGQLSLRANG